MSTKPVVIDLGSSTVKIGLGGDMEPKCVFPNVIVQSEKLVGEAALSKPRDNLQYPVQHGLITNWDGITVVLDHIFDKLQVKSTQHPVLIVDSLFTPKSNREQIVKILFEKYKVPALYLANQSVVSCYATGRQNGVVVDIGHGAAYLVPVKDGFAVTNDVEKIETNGENLTSLLQQLLRSNGVEKSVIDDRALLEDIKHNTCFVAEYYDAELKKKTEQNYSLPNGNKIVLSTERFQSTEKIFSPSDDGKDKLAQRIHNMIQKSDNTNDLYKNIILSGGTTKIKGFAHRLKKEVAKLSGKSVEVIEPANAQLSAWIGASVLSTVADFSTHWIKRAEYDQQGAQIVHKKCY